MDTRVFSLDALEKSFSLTKSKLDHEHVTLHMKNNPDLFRIINLIAPNNLFWPDLGLTLDEIGDYKLIDAVIRNLYDDNPAFGCEEILDFLKRNKILLNYNKDVMRKGDN